MEGKKSVIIYADWIATASRMERGERGDLLMLILEYINDENPDEEKYGPLVSVAFGPIKQQMKRDLVKWKEKREQRSGAGKASAEAKKNRKLEEINEIQRNSTVVDSVERTSTRSTVNVNVNVYTPYIERLCSAFNISEQRNGRSFFAATYFIEALAKDERLEYFSSQLEGYISLREPRYRGSIDKFMGTPEDNYNNGVWCKETYSVEVKDELTPEQKRIKSAYGFAPTIAK